MSRTITLRVPHHLTQEEARNRVQSGVAQVRSQFGGQVANVQETWTGNHMDFRFGVLGQSVTGTVDVEADDVVLSISLPWLLASLAEQIRPQVEHQARRMLQG